METRQKTYYALTVNSKEYSVPVGTLPGEASESFTLAQVLRDILGLTGTKESCNRGECGACTVLVNGKPTLSCSTLAIECEGKHVTTIEGVHNPLTGGIHPIQEAFIEVDAIQCGFCTPGIIMTSVAFLEENPNPTELELREALAGNICRCTGYVKYIDGLLLAAERMRAAKGDAPAGEV